MTNFRFLSVRQEEACSEFYWTSVSSDRTVGMFWPFVVSFTFVWKISMVGKFRISFIVNVYRYYYGV